MKHDLASRISSWFAGFPDEKMFLILESRNQQNNKAYDDSLLHAPNNSFSDEVILFFTCHLKHKTNKTIFTRNSMIKELWYA